MRENKSIIKILFIVNKLWYRGAQQQLTEFIAYLPKSFTHSLFIMNGSSSDSIFIEKVKNNGTEVSYNQRFNNNLMFQFRELSNFIKNNHFDIVVTIGLGASLFLGRIAGFLNRVPLVYSTLHTFHNQQGYDVPYFDFPNRILNYMLPKFTERTKCRFLPNCRKLGTKIGSLCSNYAISTLYNGIETNILESVKTHKPCDKVQSIINKLRTRQSIIQVGALDRNKNQIFTLECLNEIKKILPGTCLILVGDGELKHTLMSLVKKKKLEDDVFFTGQLNRLDCLYLISKTDVLVLSSKSESFPNVLVEAQFLEKPVVTVDVGGSSEIVEHGITGYLVKDGDAISYKNNILNLLSDHNLSHEMGINGKERVEELFSMDKKIRNFISIVHSDSNNYSGVQ